MSLISRLQLRLFSQRKILHTNENSRMAGWRLVQLCATWCEFLEYFLRFLRKLWLSFFESFWEAFCKAFRVKLLISFFTTAAPLYQQSPNLFSFLVSTFVLLVNSLQNAWMKRNWWEWERKAIQKLFNCVLAAGECWRKESLINVASDDFLVLRMLNNLYRTVARIYRFHSLALFVCMVSSKCGLKVLVNISCDYKFFHNEEQRQTKSFIERLKREKNLHFIFSFLV